MPLLLYVPAGPGFLATVTEPRAFPWLQLPAFERTASGLGHLKTFSVEQKTQPRLSIAMGMPPSANPPVLKKGI
jgi:hypothetical protein